MPKPEAGEESEFQCGRPPASSRRAAFVNRWRQGNSTTVLRNLISPSNLCSRIMGSDDLAFSRKLLRPRWVS